MPIIVESNSGSAELFTSVTGSSSRVVDNLDELKKTLSATPDEFAIVLGPGVDLEAAASLADMLRVTRPSTSVILIRRRVDTSVLAEALRSGMREVVEERDLTGLGAAVGRAKQVWTALNGPGQTESNGPVGQLITVFSPKGGVGKTTLAVNLGIALADKGSKSVCVVDLDLGFGDIAITLQLIPARTMADAVHFESGLDFSVLEPLLTPHGSGISALVAPVQPDAKDSIPAVLVGRILSMLKANFDFVVVDTAPTFDEFVLSAFDETDELLLVTTLDVPTLKNVKIAVETLDLLNFPKSRRHLVLNRADDKVGLSAEEVESTLAMKIEVAIPTSSQVANATNSGEPITSALPKHPVSQAVTRLAQSFEQKAEETPASAPKSRAAAPKRGLLRRNSR
ncbi:AAA family ATPase [Nocardioides iriomotensis]|uniref:MinD/ParA family protein n=1 Tax=Nocardioides iriomotensis TaxID=715784 RepID=A0A4Q5IXD3_9ACTN|nr:AAA family ATPase [Nocardioides iriomotensis]RYU09621.1 MinD/ParA family protein [Nocardioides iriomotensis]